MPTLNQMRTMVDNWLTNKWPTIVARQQNFFTNRGRYWQGLRTHTTPPSHTNGLDGSSIADKLNDGPGDQFSTWFNVFPEWVLELLPATVWVDVYQTPEGEHGWVLCVEATHNGTTYRRCQNVGPETNRTHNWKALPAAPTV